MHPPFPWFVAVAVDTRPGPPLAPDSPEVSASSKGLSLSWREPPTQGAAVSSYVVQVCQLSVLQGAWRLIGAGRELAVEALCCVCSVMMDDALAPSPIINQ